jgi:hypothetical protein
VHGLLPNKKAVSATSNSSQDLIEKIQELKTILIDHVTGNQRNESEYRAIRDEIRSYQEISPLLPKIFRDWNDLGSARDYLRRFKHYDERRTFIRGEFQPVISHLESNTAASANPQKFFAAGSHHDAFVEIRNILKNSTRELWVVDTWVDETIWTLLKNLPSGVSIRILTSNVKGDFALERKKFCKQYGITVEVRTEKSYHDRFILVDNQRCWHLGASIKDAGAKAFLISEIQSSGLVSAVVQDIQRTWQTATVLP